MEVLSFFKKKKNHTFWDFVLACLSELPDKAEKIRAVYQKVDELPPANYNTLERLIFHLVR